MKTFFHKLSLPFLALAALFVGGLREHFATPNAETTAGTHQSLTKLADAGFSYRHLLVKAGTDADHVNLCGASDAPVGLTDDQPAAAEDPIDVIQLGVSKRTVRMICSTAIATETDLYTAANGFAQAEPSGAGTYYKVGRSKGVGQLITTGVYEIEAEPCQIQKLTVTAGISSLTFSSTPTQAELNAFRAALVTAFGGAGKVKLI